MALKFTVKSHNLKFIFKAGTSRGILTHKKIWFINVYDTDKSIYGIGEAGPLKGLSIDDIPDFENRLQNELLKLEGIHMPVSEKEAFAIAGRVDDKLPSIRFGVETALLDLYHGGIKKHCNNSFYVDGRPLKINGLVWMGDSDLMLKRIEEKIEQGYRCIKLKIGAINFEEEMRLLMKVRKRFSASELELRVDANGAFSFKSALKVLQRLSQLDVHSIEQPIKAGQPTLMATLCKKTPVPIALDEELIGVNSYQEKKALVQKIMPQYIILKPSLLGGFTSCLEWIEIAKDLKIGWWLTSALESNIGLNAICQFASFLDVKRPQGLGTGGLYANNIDSPLTLKGENIYYNHEKKWGKVG